MSDSNNPLTPMIDFGFAVGNAIKQKRGWERFIGVPMANLAEHIVRVQILAVYLAHCVGANPEKTALQALVHDLDEFLPGDQTPYQRPFMKVYSLKAVKALISALPSPLQNLILSNFKAYKKRDKLEGQCVKDADILDTIFDLKEAQAKGCNYINHPEVQAAITIKRTKYYTQAARALHDALMSTDTHAPWDWFTKGASTFKSGQYGQ